MEITHPSIVALTSKPSAVRSGEPALVRSGNTRGFGSRTSVGASVRFIVDYADLFTFLIAVEGAVETIDLGGGSTVQSKIPLRFPDLPDDAPVQMFAERYAWESIGHLPASAVVDPPPDDLPSILAPGPAGTGWNTTHAMAEVTIDFTRPDLNWEDKVFLSRRNRIGSRVVTIPGAPYKYAPTASGAAAGKRLTQDTGIILPTQEVRITRHWAPDIASIEAEALDLIYHTNDIAITIGGKTWQPGCVLFAGFDSDEQRGGFGGHLSSRVDFSYLVDAAGWDRVMSDITGRFEPVVRFDGSGYIYPRGNITDILTL